MTQVEFLSPDGVPAQMKGGTPSPLPEEQIADALETIEFEAVLDLVAQHAAGPLGTARVRSRRPTQGLDWIRAELDRVGEVAGLFRRGDGLVSEAIPDVTQVLGRLRIQGSVLEGVDFVALLQVLRAARAVHADLERIAHLAPLSAELLRPLRLCLACVEVSPACTVSAIVDT